MERKTFFNYPNAIKILISALFVAPLILLNDFIFPFIVPKILFLRSLIMIILGAYTLLLFSDFQRFRPKFSFLTISILLFWLSLAISTFAGVDWYRSFWDNHERMLGLFTITHYVILYIVASAVITTERDWRFIFRSILVFGSLVMLLGMWQKFVNPQALLNRGSERVSATLGNAIYYSGYGLFLLFLGAIEFYRERRVSATWKYIALTTALFGFIGIFLGGTRGSLLGGIVGVGVLVVCYGFLSKTRNQITRLARYAAIVGVVTLGLLFAFRTTPFVSRLPLLGSLLNTSFSGGTAGTRVMAWGIAIDAWKEKPIFGWGPNNYYYAFNTYYNPQFLEHGWSETWFDNAHSVIFNTLTVQGAFGIITYLLIYITAISVLFMGIRRGQINQHIGFLSIAFLVAHLVGLVTVFENPTSYLYFFVFLGFVAYIVSPVKVLNAKESTESNTPKKAVIQSARTGQSSVGLSVIVWIFIALLIYITDISPARANKAVVISMQKLYAGIIDATIFDEPLSFSTPHIDDIRNDLARVIFERLPQMAQEGKTAEIGLLFDRAVQELKKNQALHPLDVRVHFTLSQYYNVGYQLTKNRDLMIQSEVELRRALGLSPKRQQFEYTLAYNLVDQARHKEAEEILRKSIENNPNIGEGWWRLAVIYGYETSTSSAQVLIDEAIGKGVVFDENGKNVLRQLGIKLPE